MQLSFADRLLGLHLSLGDIASQVPGCKGYANCCQCADCRERAEQSMAEPVRQPWEPKAA